MTALQSYTAEEQEELELALDLLRRTVTDNPYIPVEPTESQALFLTCPASEILYGGAGGGGKTVGLLMSALQYVQVPNYSAILLRKTFTDLEQAEGLIPLSHSWLGETDAKWDSQQHQWKFPKSNATLAFGYMESDQDRFRYKGPPFQFIGFDELTSFSLVQYTFMFTRRRRLLNQIVPLRTRGATNPGDRGHEWVKTRFVDSNNPDRLYIPAKMNDNPYLDLASYRESLSQVDAVTRKQMQHGDWDVRPEGNLFRREWFEGKIVDRIATPTPLRWVRRWDLAATKPRAGRDPDYAVGALVAADEDNNFFICDIHRFRESPRETERRVIETANRDGVNIPVRIEQEPGAAAKMYIDSLASRMAAFDVRGVPSVTDKVTRSKPFSAACERGDVYIVRGAWNAEFLDELCAFPEATHDDQVDAVTGGYSDLMGAATGSTAEDLAAALQYDD